MVLDIERNRNCQLINLFEQTHQFCELLEESIGNRLRHRKHLLIGFIKTKKKRHMIKLEQKKLNELIESYQYYQSKMGQLMEEFQTMNSSINTKKKMMIKDEVTMNEQIRLFDPVLDDYTRPISQEIIDHFNEMENINKALIYCDLIQFKVKKQYEEVTYFGIHQSIELVQNIISIDDLHRELNSLLTLINKRFEYRKSIHLKTSEPIHEKVSIENLNQIAKQLCLHLTLLEKEILELKKMRIEVIRTYNH